MITMVVLRVPAFADESCGLVTVEHSEAEEDRYVPMGGLDDPYIVYLNRYGGKYNPGSSDNSSVNRSSIAPGNIEIGEWNECSDPIKRDTAQKRDRKCKRRKEGDWEKLSECVQRMFSPYIRIEFTEEDPGDERHIEAVIGGHPADFFGNDKNNNVAGIAPIASNCRVIKRAVVFAFEQNITTLQRTCEVTAHEIAHAFGIDHATLCTSLMSYKGGCGPKTFQDVDAECGEFSERPCHCGGDTQNDHQRLVERLGVLDGHGKVIGGIDEGGCHAGSSSPATPVTILVVMLLAGLLHHRSRQTA